MTHELLTKSLNAAQSQVEERAYQQRKNLFDYDDVLNKQRNIIYYERTRILKSVSAQNDIFACGEQVIINVLEALKGLDLPSLEIMSYLETLFGKEFVFKYIQNSNSTLDSFSFFELKLYLFDEFWLTYQATITELSVYGHGIIENLERIPNVTVAYVTAGSYNIFCKVRARGTNDAKDIIYKIDDIPGVNRTETMIALEESINDKKRMMHAIFKEL